MESKLLFIAVSLYVFGAVGLIISFVAVQALWDIAEDLHDIARSKDNG